MENFIELKNDDLTNIDGGIDGNYLFAGAIGGLMGAGMVAAACTPGLNIVAVGALAYGGTWAGSLGVTSTIIGLVK